MPPGVTLEAGAEKCLPNLCPSSGRSLLIHWSCLSPRYFQSDTNGPPGSTITSASPCGLGLHRMHLGLERDVGDVARCL
ncbi:hypothetical protein Y1Q_0008122 [Alligator mississippiensis]|uniref:Uncharacterized protein n=1 Tax=Alligator mississippiensis TaxID=8496 RepID=A0A151MW78_ALLMI|nr:hypothetical protein Y1Q_0008122 [Alligator mississippiensis]